MSGYLMNLFIYLFGIFPTGHFGHRYFHLLDNCMWYWLKEKKMAYACWAWDIHCFLPSVESNNALGLCKWNGNDFFQDVCGDIINTRYEQMYSTWSCPDHPVPMLIPDVNKAFVSFPSPLFCFVLCSDSECNNSESVFLHSVYLLFILYPSLLIAFICLFLKS